MVPCTSSLAVKICENECKDYSNDWSFEGASQLFALDVFRMKDGSDVIIELNDCAIDLSGVFEIKDEYRIGDLCVVEISNRIGL